MAEQEKFSITKFFQGFFSPTTNAKNVQFVVWLALIVLAGFTIWKAFFMPTQTQNQRQTATVFALPGSIVTYTPKQEQKQEVKKRSWWLPIPFVEGYGFAESDGRTGAGVRGGGRWEF